MTKIITAILAVGCIMLGVGLAITSCPAMAAQPQQEWTTPTVHKKPVVQAHKAAPKASTKPVEALAPLVCPVLSPAPVAAPAPPQARVEPPKQSWLDRTLFTSREAWDWSKWPLAFLLIGGALAILFNTGRKVYAGYKSTKGITTA